MPDTRDGRSGAAAMIDGLLRESVVWGAVLFSLVAIGVGISSDDSAWAFPMVGTGVVGGALVLVAMLRRWRLGWQWITFIGVAIVQIAMLVAYWQVN